MTNPIEPHFRTAIVDPGSEPNTTYKITTTPNAMYPLIPMSNSIYGASIGSIHQLRNVRSGL